MEKLITIFHYLLLPIYGRAYIRDVNWVTYLGSVYSGGLIYGGRINGILRYDFDCSEIDFLSTAVNLLVGSQQDKT